MRCRRRRIDQRHARRGQQRPADAGGGGAEQIQFNPVNLGAAGGGGVGRLQAAQPLGHLASLLKPTRALTLATQPLGHIWATHCKAFRRQPFQLIVQEIARHGAFGEPMPGRRL